MGGFRPLSRRSRESRTIDGEYTLKLTRRLHPKVSRCFLCQGLLVSLRQECIVATINILIHSQYIQCERRSVERFLRCSARQVWYFAPLQQTLVRHTKRFEPTCAGTCVPLSSRGAVTGGYQRVQYCKLRSTVTPKLHATSRFQGKSGQRPPHVAYVGKATHPTSSPYKVLAL